MKKFESKNDELIEKFIKDPLYKITKAGDIYTLLTKNGQGISNKWRPIGNKRKDGYVRVRYQNEFLLAHRIIYRKYVGALEKEKVVDHKNGNPSDNKASNLQLINLSKSNFKRKKWAFLESLVDTLQFLKK